MRSPAILQLQALLVVVGIRSSFGGAGDQCYEEGLWRDGQSYAAPYRSRFVMRGQSGMCLAVNIGYSSFSEAANICAVHYENGTLLSNKGFEAVNLNMPKNDPIMMSAYIDISPAPPKGCWVINPQLVVGVEVNCSRQRSFICEYPRQSVCRWETMMEQNLQRILSADWLLITYVLYVQNVDGSKTSCHPEYMTNIIISGALTNCSTADDQLLFKDEWSEWSQCGKCSDQNRPSNQSRHQEVIDQCEQFAGGLKRNNTKSCPPLRCGAAKAEDDDENTSETMKATTSNGISVDIILSSRLVLVFFLSSIISSINRVCFFF